MGCGTVVAIALALAGAPEQQNGKATEDAHAKVRKVVARAIEAAGGEKALRRIKAASGKCNGTFFFLDSEGGHDDVVYRFTMKFAWQPPDRSRFELALEADGEPGRETDLSVTNGDHRWDQNDGEKTLDRDAKGCRDLVAEWYRFWLAYRPDMLLDPALKLSLKDGARVGDRSVVGIRVRSPKLPVMPLLKPNPESAAVTLYYDARSGLLLRRDQWWSSIGYTAFPVQSFFSDFRTIDGVTLPCKVVHKADGKTVMETTITELHFSDRPLPDKTFAKP